MENDPVQVNLSRVLLWSILGLILMGALSFFVVPRYEPAVTSCIEVFKAILFSVSGAKFALAIPGSKAV